MKKVLYLSSLCSIKEYEEMFRKFGSTSSHASQKFNRLLVNGLIRNGYAVDALTQRIIIGNGSDEFSTYMEEIESEIHYTYLPRCKNRVINRLMTICNAYRDIVRWAKENPKGIVICDIILGELSIAVLLASLTKRINTVAIVTDVPSVRAGDQRSGLRKIPQKIKNSIIASYKNYIFLTEKMNSLLNTKGKPYVVVEGIVDEAVLETLNTLENKSQERVCMMAGLLENVFGVDTLLKAFEKVDCPDARLHFYGRGASVPDIIQAGERDKRIKYCGELTNQQIVSEEKKATLLINPRAPIGEWTAYSFPSKNMEYMASGTPLVAYDLPCIPRDYVKYFYEIKSEEQLASLLTELLSKKREEVHQFGLEAQKWITAEKNSRKQGEKIVAMLEKSQGHMD